MPELPEVQTTVSDLGNILPGLSVKDVWTDWKKLIKKPKTFPAFKKEIVGRKFLGVERKGKNILMHLSGGKTLLVHQKMTGHLLYGRYKKQDTRNKKTRAWIAEKGPLKDDPQNRFIHLVFALSNGKHLTLSDLRKFAKVLLFETDKADELEDIKNLGPDPSKKSFTFEKFKNILSSRRGRIKDVLMKQEIISGIGNIYASEILWEADVHPFKELEKLSEEELKDIHTATKKIMKESVRLRGDSMVDYRDPFGKKGSYQDFHRAYKKEGEKCSKGDGGIIKRVKKGGRSSFFCSVHQKL